MPQNPDSMQAVERNPYVGAFADLLAATFSPERTQQMQGVAKFMGAPAVASTLDKMSYGDSLVTGRGQTLQMKPDVAEAALTVAPFISPAARLGGRALQAGARELAPQAGRMAENYMTRMGMQLNAAPPTNVLASRAAPQDEALRLAQQRAALPVSQGGLGLPTNNTAQQRAQAMGFEENNPLYHATDAATDFGAFVASPRGKLGAGVYTSPSAKYTEKYVGGENARIMPLVTRGKFSDEDAKMTIAEDIRQQLVDQNPNFSVQEWKDKTLQELRRQGYAGSDTAQERVVFDPENLRSRFAAFDPYRKSAATAAAFGVAAPDLLAAESKDEVNTPASGNPYVKAFTDLLATSKNVFGFLSDPAERQGIRQGFTDAVNRGAVAATLGAPVDMANTALNLGKAAVGYLGNKAGVLSADQTPQLIDNPIGGSEFIGNQMQRFGMVSPNRNALAEGLAGFLPMSPSTSGKAVAAIAGGGMVPGLEAATFIGPNAKTWDAAAATRAVEMEKSGVPAKQIWSETGTFRGADGLLRQEISDRAAQNKFTPPDVFTLRDINRGEFIKPDDFMVKYPNTPEAAALRMNNSIQANSLMPDAPTLKDTLSHPELFSAYPEASNIRMIMSNLRPVGSGGYSSAEKAIVLGPSAGKNADSILMHEAQHAIQHREGFARGGDPEEFTNYSNALKRAKANGGVDPVTGDADFVIEDQIKRYGEDPYEAYRRLAGEAEARATQARMNMTPAERRATFPFDSYDVPVNQLIIRR
jgi:hypothetical protein